MPFCIFSRPIEPTAKVLMPRTSSAVTSAITGQLCWNLLH